MREIGGYIELDTYQGHMLYENGILLNSGRSGLAYLIESKNIKKISIPYFLCNCIYDTCVKYGVNINKYNIDADFRPLNITFENDRWLYLVNFYGQLTPDYIRSLQKTHSKIIVDNSQAYFDSPIDNVDTIYTCRKFFGVTDGAVLFSDSKLERKIEMDISNNRMGYLLGRYEGNASDYYFEYVENNKLFYSQPIKEMSKLTYNILHAVDYDYVKNKRTENFSFLNKKLKQLNLLNISDALGGFMYPLLVKDGDLLRKKLISKKIYVPLLWPNVLKETTNNMIEYYLANNIVPLPCDQRYTVDDMHYMIGVILDCLD